MTPDGPNREKSPEMPDILIERDSTAIGRRKDCDAVVPDSGTSKSHCRIDRVDGSFTIVDMDSQNGTFVNEERVSSRLLASGDRLRIGYSVYEFTVTQGGASGKLAFVKKVKPLSSPPQDGQTMDAAGRDDEALPGVESEPPWVDAASGAPVAQLIDPEPPSSQPAALRPETGEGPAPAAPPAVVAPVAGKPEAPAVPAPPPAPKLVASAREDARAAPPGSHGALLLSAVAFLVLAMAVFFAPELKALVGIGGAAPALLPPQAAPAPLEAGKAERQAAAALSALQADVAALRFSLSALEGLRGLEPEVKAIRLDLDESILALERDQRALLDFMEVLKQGAKKAAMKEAAEGGGKAPAAVPEQPMEQLSPEELLFREVMNALEGKN